jgi:hypothetical protein
MGRMIPKKNPAALIAYYAGLGSCLCGLAGPVALYFGLKALRAYKANPEIHGRTHAWVGVILGGLMTLATLAWAVFMLLGMTGHIK